MITSLSIGLILFCAGLIQGLTGFGSALVAIPLLCFVVDIKTAVPLCTLSSVIITSMLILQLRRHINFKTILPLCLSSIPGIIVGVGFLKSVDASIIRLTLGLLIVGYACYSLFITPQPRKLSAIWAWVAGFFSGAIGAAFSAGGPPTIIYTTLSKDNRSDIKATLTGFFWFNSTLTAVVHAASGISSGHLFYLFLLGAPFVMGGTLLGAYLFRFIPEKKYVTIIFIFLIIMGSMMIFGPS